MSLDIFDTAEARALELCNYCPRLCHFACPTAHGDGSETATAWGLMSLANGFRRGDIPLDEDAARHLFRCTSCGRCTDFCRHDNPVADVLVHARGALHNARLTPPELAPLGVETSFEITEGNDSARVLFVPACHGQPHSLASAVVAKAAGGTVDIATVGACCGGAAKRAGFEANAMRLQGALTDASARYDVVVSECGTAQAAAGTRSLSTAAFLRENAERLGAPSDAAGTITLHGGCRQRRANDQRTDEVALLTALGATVEDAFAIEGSQECCGGDGVYDRVSPTGAARAARAVVNGARRSDTPLVTSAQPCACHMAASADEPVVSVVEWVAARCL